MSAPTSKSSIPPFVDEDAKKSPPEKPAGIKVPEPINLAIMFIGWGILTIAMIGGTKVLWDILSDGIGNDWDGLIAKAIALGLAFIIGWVVSMVSIRTFGNRILPLILTAYIWLVVLGIAAVYLRVSYKLYNEDFVSEQFARYSIVMIAGFFILLALHLLVEDHNASPLAFVLLIAGMLHLFAIVLHYVFLPVSNPVYIGGDVYFLIFDLAMAGLLGTNLFFLTPARNRFKGIGAPGSEEGS